MISVKKDSKRISSDPFPTFICLVDLVSGQSHPETARVSRGPVVIRHLGPVRFKPVDIFDFSAMNRSALKEAAATEDYFGFPERDQFPNKVEKRLLFGGKIPIKPGQHQILPIGIIVTVVVLSHFI